MAAIDVDGDLSDWGITVKTGAVSQPGIDKGGSTYPTDMASFITSEHGASYVYRGHAVEDTDDVRTDAYTVGPNSGGQNYDAEFLGLVTQGNTLFIAVMSGQRTDNGFSKYAPGDLYIETSLNGQLHKIYGIEVGGGFGNSSGTASALVEGDLGTTYKLDSNGNTIGAKNSDSTFQRSSLSVNLSSLTGDGRQVVGSIWDTSIADDWIKDPIDSSGGNPVNFNNKIATQLNIQTSTTTVGTANIIHTRDENLYGDPGTGSQHRIEHSVIELSLDLSKIEGKITHVRWSPSCGNDVIWYDDDGFGSTNEVPEPTGIVIWTLLGSGALGLTYCRRRLVA